MSSSRSRPNWWSEQWLALLAELGADPSLLTGRMSRRIRVLSVDAAPGEIRSRVRSRDEGEGEVRITLATFSHEQWDRVIERLSSQALFAARLLVGELPVEVEQVFSQAGVALLPQCASELAIACSLCQPAGGPCLPVVAVMRRVGEMLNDDPWLLFRVRGRQQDEVLQALRASRTADPGVAPAPVPLPGLPLPPVENRQVYYAMPDVQPMAAEPLSLHLDDFWGDAGRQADIHHHIVPPAIELALLRRLGYLPLSSGSPELYQALLRAYGAVTRQALNLAYEADPEQDEDEGEWSEE